eukprot:1010061-Pelagomonas_calceolata.AAC.2
MHMGYHHGKGRGLANGLKPVTWLAAAAAAKGNPTMMSFCLPTVMAYTASATSAGVWLIGSARTVCLHRNWMTNMETVEGCTLEYSRSKRCKHC